MDEGIIQSDIGSMRPLDNSEVAYDAYVVEFRGGIDGFLSADGLETLVEVLDALSRPVKIANMLMKIKYTMLII